jgi:hypothetical protein
MLGQFDGGVTVWPDAVATLGNDEVLDLGGVEVVEGDAGPISSSATVRHVAVSRVDIVVSGSNAQAVVTSWLASHSFPDTPAIGSPLLSWEGPALAGTTQKMASAVFDKSTLDSLVLAGAPGERWAGIRLTWPTLDGTAQPTAVDVLRIDGFLIAHGAYGVTSVPTYGKGSEKRHYVYVIPGSTSNVAHTIYNRT